MEFSKYKTRLKFFNSWGGKSYCLQLENIVRQCQWALQNAKQPTSGK